MVFLAFHWILIAFCERPKFRTLGGLGSDPRRAFSRVQKTVQNLENISFLSFSRSTCHGFLSFSLVFIAFCERPK